MHETLTLQSDTGETENAQHTNVTIRYMRKQKMYETLTEQSITGETENARYTNGTIRYRRKLRIVCVV